MNPLQFTKDRAPVVELDRVRLKRRVTADSGANFDAGSKGTVVSVYGGGEAFCIEFTHPTQALVTVGCDDFEVIAEETIARLEPSTGPLLR